MVFAEHNVIAALAKTLLESIGERGVAPGVKRLETLASWFDRQHPVRKLSDLAGGLIGDLYHQSAGIAGDTQTEPGDDQHRRESELRDSNPR